LTLNEEGRLEGQVVLEYTGHVGADRRETFDGDSPLQREETLRSEVKERNSSAEISEIRFENMADPFQPLRIAYTLKIPRYAQRTGKRIFLQPAVFQQGLPPRFPAGLRRYPIYFRYPWSEADRVTIRLPQGYIAESPASPAVFEPGKMLRYECGFETSPDAGVVAFKRRLEIGREGRIYAEAGNYQGVRHAFETIQERDSVSISVRQPTATPEQKR
jgi:hypothetical protein